MRQDALNIRHFVDAFGDRGALYVWPWVGAQAITSLPLHRLNQTFVSGMARVMQLLPSYTAIRQVLTAAAELPFGEPCTEGQIQEFRCTVVALRQQRNAPPLNQRMTVHETLHRQLRRGDNLQHLLDLFHSIPRRNGESYIGLHM